MKIIKEGKNPGNWGYSQKISSPQNVKQNHHLSKDKHCQAYCLCSCGRWSAWYQWHIPSCSKENYRHIHHSSLNLWSQMSYHQVKRSSTTRSLLQESTKKHITSTTKHCHTCYLLITRCFTHWSHYPYQTANGLWKHRKKKDFNRISSSRTSTCT